MSYSLDFRRHVLDFKVKHNLTFEETSEHFEISIRSLFRWSKKIEPCAHRNKPPTKIATQSLLDDIAKYPNAVRSIDKDKLDCPPFPTGPKDNTKRAVEEHGLSDVKEMLRRFLKNQLRN